MFIDNNVIVCVCVCVALYVHNLSHGKGWHEISIYLLITMCARARVLQPHRTRNQEAGVPVGSSGLRWREKGRQDGCVCGARESENDLVAVAAAAKAFKCERWRQQMGETETTENRHRSVFRPSRRSSASRRQDRTVEPIRPIVPLTQRRSVIFPIVRRGPCTDTNVDAAS